MGINVVQLHMFSLKHMKPINFDIKTDYSNDAYQEKDMQRFFIEGGDPGFNPDRNKAVIEGTIKHNNNLLRNYYMKYNDKLRERVNATVMYMRHLNSGKSGNASKYFGKRELARLRGIEVANEMKNVTRIQVDGYYAKKGVWQK